MILATDLHGKIIKQTQVSMAESEMMISLGYKINKIFIEDGEHTEQPTC